MPAFPLLDSTFLDPHAWPPATFVVGDTLDLKGVWWADGGHSVWNADEGPWQARGDIFAYRPLYVRQQFGIGKNKLLFGCFRAPRTKAIVSSNHLTPVQT
jgi:hypothetical protein